MTTAALKANQQTNRVVAGSATVNRVPVRGYRKRAQTASTRRAGRSGQVVTTPHRQAEPKPLQTVNKVRRKGTASVRAFVISGTLLIPALLQMALAAALAYAIGFLNLGFVAWLTQNFELVDETASYFVGGMWAILIILNISMFLYSMTAYLISFVNIFKPLPLIALAIFFSLSLFPPVNIIPWVLVYVWVVALTR